MTLADVELVTRTCAGCGRTFAQPADQPARSYCDDPACRRRAKARRSWRSTLRRHDERIPRQASLLEPYSPSDLRNLTPRFIDDPDTHLYEVILAGDPCSFCGAGADGRMQPDHIDPHARGGDATWQNLTSGCIHCNSSKQDQPLLLWLLTSPRLNQLRLRRRQGVLFDLQEIV